MLSVHSAVCGTACGLSLWAEEDREEMKRCLHYGLITTIREDLSAVLKVVKSG